MLKQMSMKLIEDFGKQYKIDPALLLAIGKTESNLQLFDKNGQLIKRFEKWIYRGFLLVQEGKLKRHPALPGLNPDWIKKHSKNELIKISTSWGLFQIMGYYYPELGYNKIDDLIEDWNVEEVCVHKFLEFCVKYREGKFLKALQNNDYQQIALMYNGTGYKNNNYDVKLENNHKEIQKVIKTVN